MAGKKRKRNAGYVMAQLEDALRSEPAVLDRVVRKLCMMLQGQPRDCMEGVASDLIGRGLLTRLPELLQHPCPEVAVGAAEVLGLLAVSSYEINCKVASEEEVLKALGQMLLSRDAGRLMGACDAVMDVAVTPLGCISLGKSPGLQEHLLDRWLLSYLADVLSGGVKTSSLKPTELSDASSVEAKRRNSPPECAIAREKEDTEPEEFPIKCIAPKLTGREVEELFDLALASANVIFCDSGDHDSITSHVLASLRKLWEKSKDLWFQQLKNVTGVCEKGLSKQDCTLSNKCHQLSKLIVQLAMCQKVLLHSVDTVRHNLFKGTDSCFEHFFQEHWETSPAVITRGFPESELFALFGDKVCIASPTKLLKDLVCCMVSCPPASADEVDPVLLFRDVENNLGEPPVQGQDIHLVKSEAGMEVHYIGDRGTGFVTAEDCVQAYENGYTVAIRGMEFRFPEIAAMSEAVALALGQVTVGANLYLTPPNAQGLIAHHDDHCVFVCQLAGHKRWTVYPAEQLLPRLYTFKALLQEPRKDLANQLVLDEGSVLYIPRGFPHEAHTKCLEIGRNGPSWETDNESRQELCGHAHCPIAGCPEHMTTLCSWTRLSNESVKCKSRVQQPKWAGASLHLSLGVEVEPAFEWEGLLHIALRIWAHQQQQQATQSAINKCRVEDLSEGLLHTAIRNIAKNSKAFRKACILAGPTPAMKGTTGKSCMRTAFAEQVFSTLVKEIAETANFQEAVQEHQMGLAWLGWLRHLPVGMIHYEWSPSEFSADLLQQAFSYMTHAFGQEAAFMGAMEAQCSMLGAFRNCRRKLINGMLALHSSYTM